jgi:hypothetical protein
MAQKLWRDNITVKCSGKGNSTLTLVGGFFASNANKEDTRNSLYDLLYLLRFKRLNFLWYEYEDPYSYYNISSPKDSEHIEMLPEASK